MVGIVIVSHSKKLAEGVRELAEQMVQGGAALAIAAGIDEPENPIGTDPLTVQAAIESVYSDDGVLVLMDLGSALMSAEMALEFLPEAARANVMLTGAPLVEGTLAAAVQAASGASLVDVEREARGALAVKQAQLRPALQLPEGAQDGEATAVFPSEPSGETKSIQLEVGNRLGLHARPAARFVATAGRFTADLRIAKGEQTANAKSINAVATLGVRQGDTITVTAVGPDAAGALAALQALADDNFGDPHDPDDPDDPVATSHPAADRPATEAGVLAGIPGSPGIAVGPAAPYRPTLPEVTVRSGADPAAEWARLETAVAASVQELSAIQAGAARRVGAAEAAIFEAHRLILADPELGEAVRQRLRDEQINAEAAWNGEVEALARRYAGMADSFMQARAADVRDAGDRVLRRLMGVERPSLALERPSILVAADLTPSDTAGLDPANVLGIVVERGGATSHSTILARALGIPAVVGVGPAAAAIGDGDGIALDGTTGRVWLSPDEAKLAQLRAARAAWQAQQRAAQAEGQEAAVTRDGHRVEVAANISGAAEAKAGLGYGAEGVGLFRTEFLFMGRKAVPSEEEQLAAYRAAAEAMGERPLVVRTLDIGGDKPLPYLERPLEENPFLGWRGIRFSLDRPEIFMPQLRAILRASVDESGRPCNVKVMFPMVSTAAEFRAAREMLAEAEAELRAQGRPFDEAMEVGLMIECPAAVAVADQLAAEADFFSIGTNDLTQYVMAADRGNAQVAGLADALQPAVLRLVDQTVRAAHAAGIWVGMCGELAGDPLATAVLVGLGLDELSMAAPSIPAVKAAVRALSLERAREVAAAVLAMEGATAVRSFLASLTA